MQSWSGAHHWTRSIVVASGRVHTFASSWTWELSVGIIEGYRLLLGTVDWSRVSNRCSCHDSTTPSRSSDRFILWTSRPYQDNVSGTVPSVFTSNFANCFFIVILLSFMTVTDSLCQYHAGRCLFSEVYAHLIYATFRWLSLLPFSDDWLWF
jgi:hypothetical protein